MYDVRTLSALKQNWLMGGANIPSRFIGLEPADLKAKVGEFHPDIEDWIENVLSYRSIKAYGGVGTTGVGLLFDGGPGLGKTTHAVVTLAELIRRIPESPEEARKVFSYKSGDWGPYTRPVYYLTFPEFLHRKKALIDAKGDEREKLLLEMEGLHGRATADHMNIRVLVLDDLGKEYGTDYTSAGFDEILRSRYDKALPTIVTTNVPLESWGRKYGEAMESFANEAFIRVPVGKKDLRRAKA